MNMIFSKFLQATLIAMTIISISSIAYAQMGDNSNYDHDHDHDHDRREEHRRENGNSLGQQHDNRFNQNDRQTRGVYIYPYYVVPSYPYTQPLPYQNPTPDCNALQSQGNAIIPYPNNGWNCVFYNSNDSNSDSSPN
jgi:hypothetical protein